MKQIYDLFYFDETMSASMKSYYRYQEEINTKRAMSMQRAKLENPEKVRADSHKRNHKHYWKDPEKSRKYQSIYAKKRRLEKTEHVKEVQRQCYQRLKQRAYSILTKHEIITCDDCPQNELDYLNLHHVNGDGKYHRQTVKSGGEIYRWIIKNPEEACNKLNILCVKCHNKTKRKK